MHLFISLGVFLLSWSALTASKQTINYQVLVGCTGLNTGCLGNQICATCKNLKNSRVKAKGFCSNAGNDGLCGVNDGLLSCSCQDKSPSIEAVEGVCGTDPDCPQGQRCATCDLNNGMGLWNYCFNPSEGADLCSAAYRRHCSCGQLKADNLDGSNSWVAETLPTNPGLRLDSGQSDYEQVSPEPVSPEPKVSADDTSTPAQVQPLPNNVGLSIPAINAVIPPENNNVAAGFAALAQFQPVPNVGTETPSSTVQLQPLSDNGAETFPAPIQIHPIANDATDEISAIPAPKFQPKLYTFAANLAGLGQSQQQPSIFSDPTPLGGAGYDSSTN